MSEKFNLLVNNINHEVKSQCNMKSNNFFLVKIKDKSFSIITETDFNNCNLKEKFKTGLLEYEILFLNKIQDLKPDSLVDFTFVKSILCMFYATDNVINIPNSVEGISFNNSSNYKNIVLNDNIKKIILNCVDSENLKFPESIESLYLKCNSLDPNIHVDMSKFDISNLSNLKHLYVSCFDGNIINFPESIESFYVKSCNDQEYDKLPKNLNYLSIDGFIKKNVILDFLPDTLETLLLHFSFDGKLDNLPKNLKYLSINGCIGKNVSLDFLPDTLETLLLNYTFKGKMENLPNSLRKVMIKWVYCRDNKCYADIVPLLKLPKFKTLELPKDFYDQFKDHFIENCGKFKSKYNKNIDVILT